MPDKKIPTGRYQRLAAVGRVAGTQAAKRAGTRAANLVRSPQSTSAALERRHIATAEQIVAVLGRMKGASMKLGQMLSVLDVGLVPEEYREEFQRRLGALREQAPAVSFKDMRKVIETELGERLSGAFSDFGEQPIAAASIGQVYRATLRDGRTVAVKVQYPGVRAAVAADMANLSLIVGLLGRLAPQMDTKALAKEVREEIFQELDYELEASNQRALGRLYDGHPFIAVPAVVSERCGERVIVTEFVQGDRFAALQSEGEAERNRVGEIVFRFFLGSMYRHGMFSGDPHPGNLLRREDGRIAFLDFGLFKRLGGEPIQFTLQILRAVIERNESELHRLLANGGFLPDPARFDPSELMSYMLDAYWWCTSADREVHFSPQTTKEIMHRHLGRGSENLRTTRQMDLDAEHLLGRRLELMVLAVLGQLQVSANWHRIAREWIYGDPPGTELGRQEADFLGGLAAQPA
ncbi:MAG TPA: AarF/ABC1/UbiB kinase family protein [Solirubrobacteraceae bacterium]|jgi:predicted unusual protein kinase regulating ubiquinone biosynthesis (AarF/ABC1/UbiB family)